MLSELPLEILLQITDYLENETLLDLYQVSRRLYYLFEPRLQDVYRVRTIDLGCIPRQGEINVRHHLTPQRALKFVEELTVAGHCEHDRQNCCGLHLQNCLDSLGVALMPLFRGLTRNGLVTFRWRIRACAPPPILGSRGYLRRHQRNIQTLDIRTSPCAEDVSPNRKLSISRFHNVRSLCWTGISTPNHIAALTEFLAASAHRLEELTLTFSRPRWQRATWRGIDRDWMRGWRNSFAFSVLKLERGSTRCLFPRLRKLDLNANYEHAYTELAYAFNMHKLVDVDPHSYDMLRTMAALAENNTLPLSSLTIYPDEDRRELMDGELFTMSLPNLQDLFFPFVYANTQTSLLSHLRWVFSQRRPKLRRFVHHGHLVVAGDVASVWDSTVAPMVCDAEIAALLVHAELQIVGLSDHLPTLQFHLCTNPPTTWQVLHIQALATIHDEYHPHQPTFTLSYDPRSLIANPPPNVIDLTTYRSRPTAAEMIDVLSFASWAFGPEGLPNLDLFAFGHVMGKRWNDVLQTTVFLTRNDDAGTRGLWSYRQVRVEDEAIKRIFEENWECF
ncbi:hypothetical protein BJX64DRAFT_291582 [Aspergillus heterothallicus]